jgi:uncharacterized membrane-anchored protein
MNFLDLKRWTPWLLVLLCVIQLAVPAFMIVRREHALTAGRAFKFKTAPVDPYDAYRGRYVALRFEAATVKGISLPAGVGHGARVYALLGEDEKGFARVTALSMTKPPGGSYLRGRVQYPEPDQVLLEFPFDRYYMEETKAPAAESAYRRHGGRETSDTYAVVKILGPQAVLQELYVGGFPIEEFLRRSK